MFNVYKEFIQRRMYFILVDSTVELCQNLRLAFIYFAKFIAFVLITLFAGIIGFGIGTIIAGTPVFTWLESAVLLSVGSFTIYNSQIVVSTIPGILYYMKHLEGYEPTEWSNV